MEADARPGRLMAARFLCRSLAILYGILLHPLEAIERSRTFNSFCSRVWLEHEYLSDIGGQVGRLVPNHGVDSAIYHGVRIGLMGGFSIVCLDV